jgi:hypothetical protein
LNDRLPDFGSYGDILLRDRKMYVAPTPFALMTGTAENRTLVLPAAHPADERLEIVGKFDRAEADRVLTSYTFDLEKNLLTGEYKPNPTSGRIHSFCAWRRRGD